MTPPRSVEAWAACGEHGGCDVFSPDCPYCRDNRRNFIDYAAEQVAQARAEERETLVERCRYWQQLAEPGELVPWQVMFVVPGKDTVLTPEIIARGLEIAAAIRART